MRYFGIFFTLCLVLACSHPLPTQVPGSTPIKVRSVTIESVSGKPLLLSYGKLIPNLGHRPANVILPPRNFNEFRLAEDKRRIETWANAHGYFDAKAGEPEVVHHKTGAATDVSIAWKVKLGPEYRIGEMQLVGVPEEARAEVMEAIPFREGSKIAVLTYRPLRHSLADIVRWHGYAHARVFSRAWVDRENKTLRWYYFVDPGPKTVIASLDVRGNSRLSAEDIIDRSGLRVGQPYAGKERARAKLRLMDGGSLASVSMSADDDVHKGPPILPDNGGTPLIDAAGNLKPRNVDAGLHLTIAVIEAPHRVLRLEAGAEVDPARSDLFAGGRLVVRDLGTAGLHASVDGTVGYGYEIGDSDEPLGVYGTVSAQLTRASLFGSRVDARVRAKVEHTLFAGAAVRELSAGPGVYTALADQLYLDVELLAFRAEETNALDLGASDRMAAGLAEERRSLGTKLQVSLTRDARNNGIEATDGHFFSARSEYAPAILGGTHPYLLTAADARIFKPLSPLLSLSGRLSGSWLSATSASGIALHNRLFGGGSYGYRGAGRMRFSPSSGTALVGGESLVEASFEGRMLPNRELYGAVAFVDFAGVSTSANPFASGLSTAFGIGARVRTFYIPLAIDLSYELIDQGSFSSPITADPWSIFARLGEAF